MKGSVIGFGAWEPDKADTSNPSILAKCINAQPKVGGYGPTAALLINSTATALPATPRGSASGVDGTGVYQAFIGTAATIERLSNLFVPASVGTGFSCTAGDNWSFAVFGKYMLATNSTDGVKAYDLDAGGTFAAVSGAPVARGVFTAFNVAFAYDCDGNNRLLRNSGLVDHTNWLTGKAGYQEFQDGEAIVGGGEVGLGVALLFQRNAIRLLTYHSQILYESQTLAKEQGAVNPECIVFVKGGAYFIDTDGFYFAHPGGVEPIGAGRVDETFLARIATGGLDSVQGAYDPSRHRVIWRYQRDDVASTTVFEDMIVYDIRHDQWYEEEETTTAILTMATPGYVLDGMDSFGSLDEMTQIALDSRYWFGGEPLLGGVDENLKFGFFNGDNLAVTLETTTHESELSTMITRVKPLTDATAPTVLIGTSDDLDTSLTWTAGDTKTRGGVIPVRARGKNMRFRMTIPAADATFTQVRGINDVTGNTGGPQ